MKFKLTALRSFYINFLVGGLINALIILFSFTTPSAAQPAKANLKEKLQPDSGQSVWDSPFELPRAVRRLSHTLDTDTSNKKLPRHHILTPDFCYTFHHLFTSYLF
jgi:hypothetical protein